MDLETLWHHDIFLHFRSAFSCISFCWKIWNKFWKPWSILGPIITFLNFLDIHFWADTFVNYFSTKIRFRFFDESKTTFWYWANKSEHCCLMFVEKSILWYTCWLAAQMMSNVLIDLKYLLWGNYSGGQKGWNDIVSKITNKVVLSFLATTVFWVVIETCYQNKMCLSWGNYFQVVLSVYNIWFHLGLT